MSTTNTQKTSVRRDESIYSSSTSTKQTKGGSKIIDGSGKRPIFMKAIKGCDIERE